MRRTIRSTETLAKMPLFRSLSASETSRLDTQCVWRTVHEDKWIIEHHEQTDDVIFVVSGAARVKIQSISGREVLLREISAGEFFGEIAAIDGHPRSSGIVAVTGVVVARMPSTVFRAAIHSYPDVCDQLLGILARQIRILTNRVDEFANLNVRHRVYAELLRLARSAAHGAVRKVISPPPLHAEIAARISTRREAVAREIKALERAGLVIRRRGGLELINPEAMRQLIEDASSE